MNENSPSLIGNFFKISQGLRIKIHGMQGKQKQGGEGRETGEGLNDSCTFTSEPSHGFQQTEQFRPVVTSRRFSILSMTVGTKRYTRRRSLIVHIRQFKMG